MRNPSKFNFLNCLFPHLKASLYDDLPGSKATRLKSCTAVSLYDIWRCDTTRLNPTRASARLNTAWPIDQQSNSIWLATSNQVASVSSGDVVTRRLLNHRICRGWRCWRRFVMVVKFFSAYETAANYWHSFCGQHANRSILAMTYVFVRLFGNHTNHLLFLFRNRAQ